VGAGWYRQEGGTTRTLVGTALRDHFSFEYRPYRLYHPGEGASSQTAVF
jgi:hypothetical protein